MVRFRIECQLAFSQHDFWRLRASPAFLEFIVADGLLKKMEASPSVQEQDGWFTRRQHYCPQRVECPDFIRAAIGDTMFAVDDDQRWNDDLHPFELQFFIRPSFLKGVSRTSGKLSVDPHPDCAPKKDMESLELERVYAVADAMCESTIADDSSSYAAPMDECSTEDGEDGDEALSSSGTSTDAECSEASESSDLGDAELPKEQIDTEAYLAALSPSDKSMHVVAGETRVSILTLGWFIERSIVHNLRMFYKDYPATIVRFRQKLYNDFANGDTSVPCSVVVDRFLEFEAQRLRKPIAQEDVEDVADVETASEQSTEEEDESDLEFLWDQPE